MEETSVTQYFFCPNDTIYHLVSNEHQTVCGRHVDGKPEQRRRRDDFRIVTEKPEGFTALCRKCQGLPEYESPSLGLIHCRRSHPNYRDEIIASMP
jgi:hypothetical protein